MVDIELRLAALENLVHAKTEEVEQRLLAELSRVENVLRGGTDYDDLSAALKTLAVLAPRFHARVIPILTDFVRSVPARVLQQNGESVPLSWLKYRSPSHLIRDAIDVPHAIRFIHTERLLDFLVELWESTDADVRGKAAHTLGRLAEFDLNLFYGERGLGARPQAEIVAYFTKLSDASLVSHAEIVLIMMREVLSPSISGHTSSYNSMTINRGSITSAGGVADMRASAIALLKRMYVLSEEARYRRGVLNALNAAVRREKPSNDAASTAMFDRDAVDVLNFLRDQVPAEELSLVQAIEHAAYWSYFHAATDTVVGAALAVRDAISGCVEYKIYKNLIGFEGVHGEWEELKLSGSMREYGDDERLRAAARYVDEISDENYGIWRDRILVYSKTRSDDLATFPIYYRFLESIGQKRPRLALELVRDHQGVMAPFLIALLRGLWSSEYKTDAETVAHQWISDRVHLTDLAKSLNVNDQPRLDLLARVISVADGVEGTSAIVEAMGVAARQYMRGYKDAKNIFMQGLREVSKHNDARWANVFWFSRDFAKLVRAMEPSERAEVLASLVSLVTIDYQAEEVLYAIGQDNSDALLDFLMTRVREDNARDDDSSNHVTAEGARFEAIPYQFTKLDKLLVNMPEKILFEVRRLFKAENGSMFAYSSSARLIKAVFPSFDKGFQDELRTYLKTGRSEDIEFVVSVVRTYEGYSSVLPICKEVIQALPEKSDVWSKVAAALQSTGVVSGEYGIVNAYEAKRDEILRWLDDSDARVRAFAVWFIESLNLLIERERQRADESIALRKHKYGLGALDS